MSIDSPFCGKLAVGRQLRSSETDLQFEIPKLDRLGNVRKEIDE